MSALVGYYKQNPTNHDQHNGHIDIVNEKTSLPYSLETPVHAVSAEKSSALGSWIVFYLTLVTDCLGISNLTLN